MKLTILSVGKIKEDFFKAAVSEYVKRLSKYADINMIEVSDEKAPESLSAAEEEIIKNKEGDKLLKNIPHGDYVICLSIDGKRLSSEELSNFTSQRMVSGVSRLTFVIGGSLGLGSDVLARADYKLSFSAMTFPHQLMKVILLEQIYRSMKIMKNEPYHK